MSTSPDLDSPHEEALLAGNNDLASAVRRGDATTEELIAALEAVRQVPIDPQRMLNAIHVPGNAGEYEDALRGLLERIPDWGRWISCRTGWYRVLAQLDARLRQIDPDYRVYQVKENFGTLRFYWSGRDYETGEKVVADAGAESARTCERCGSPGRLRKRRGWLRTLYDECAGADGYEDVTDEDGENVP